MQAAFMKPHVGLLLITTPRFHDLGEGTEHGVYHRRKEQEAERIVKAASAFSDILFPGVVYTGEDIKGAIRLFEQEEADMVFACFLSWADDFAWIRFLRDMKPVPILFASLVRDELGFEDSMNEDRFVEFLSAGTLVGMLEASGSASRFDRPMMQRVIGTLDSVMHTCSRFANAARLRSQLKQETFGLLPSLNEVMWATYVDIFALQGSWSLIFMKYDHKPAIMETAHNGIPVVRLHFGSYEADICPDMGSNCIRIARDNLSVLRTPPDMDTFRDQPNVYGMPLLFPPNRIQGGTYTYQGRVYRFPVNEPARGHHIHGFLSSTPFSPAEQSISAEGVSASFQASFDERSPYLAFPHAFSVRLDYLLNDDGLLQTVTLQNGSPLDMPCGLGFHTSFNLPFVPETRGEEYRLYAHVEDEICLDPVTIIPTGERRNGGAAGQALREGGLTPAGSPLSNHFGGRSGEITLTHVSSGAAVRYLPDRAFSFLMLWNGGGQSGFVCPEPQTWQVDAPNSLLPPEMSGFTALKPGGTAVLSSRLCIDPGSL